MLDFEMSSGKEYGIHGDGIVIMVVWKVMEEGFRVKGLNVEYLPWVACGMKEKDSSRYKKTKDSPPCCLWWTIWVEADTHKEQIHLKTIASLDG